VEKHPKTVLELRDWFPDEESCREYLRKLRWPWGFKCPGCGSSNHWITSRHLFHCRSCERQTSVTAGTLFMDTHLPLRLWFEAIWQVTSQKYGASALGLQRVLGLGSYRSAWTLLHKFRRAMVRPGRDRLKGLVEIDEIYVGGFGNKLRNSKIKNWFWWQPKRRRQGKLAASGYSGLRVDPELS